MIRHNLAKFLAGLSILIFLSGIVTGQFVEGLQLAFFWFILFLIVVPKNRYRGR
jgi:hypothetical protein